MSYSALSVANEFIKIALSANEAKYDVTNMKLQKLVYIAHGYHLGLWQTPFIHNDIHAFEWGPVIPVLYSHLKSYGAAKVDKLIPTSEVRVDPVTEMALVRKVWNAYGHFDGIQLSRITHKPETPWSKTWAKSKHGVITDDLIQDHYKKLLDERKAITASQATT